MHQAEPKADPRHPLVHDIESLVADACEKCDDVGLACEGNSDWDTCESHEPRSDSNRRRSIAELGAVIRSFREEKDDDEYAGHQEES